MLPVQPQGPGFSPYSSISAFAGNPLLISLDLLADQGWIEKGALPDLRSGRGRRVQWPAVETLRTDLLRTAFENFRNQDGLHSPAYLKFCKKQKAWLPDYQLFCALREQKLGPDWGRWPEPFRRRDAETLKQARRELAECLDYHGFLQFQFHNQWRALRKYAGTSPAVGLIGDLPIFVTYDSVDVWAHPDLFRLQESLHPEVVTGVPPDAFSDTGQLWGHPHYRWSQHEANGFRWWMRRFRHLFRSFDLLRVDHFIGFYHAWEVKAEAETAEQGQWVRAPGEALFQRLRSKLGNAALIAEDLGAMTPEIHAFRDRLGFPGMRVLQWAFGPNARYDQPHRHPPNSVVYTGTHDNDTLQGWFSQLGEEDRQRALDYSHGDPQSIHWDVIRLAYASPARTAIVPMQDFLGLDSKARMNTPGTGEKNWQWRMYRRELNSDLAQRIRALAETFERLPTP